ncbi:DUF6368 family protein [Streptomyces sp. NPDC020845]|uniref:DUF6368 family protein n=1 Tax=Streptomyces sp. NPDC020845 TaxID=3365096 RepID=UPI00378DD82F
MGAVLVIELAEAPSASAIQRLRDYLVASSSRFEEKRVGEYDLHVWAESLGITDTGGVDGHRLVSGLPGVMALMTDPWATAHGSAEFLRAWAEQPGFRLLK